MPSGYPITLVNLMNALSVVIGGGNVAERKIRSLLEAQARVRVVSPQLTAELLECADKGEIEWLSRAYRDGDLVGAFLVIVATDDTRINHAIADAASELGCLINVVDDPAYCNFFIPAVVRRGDLTIAISTGGDAPALAKHLREELEMQFGEEWGAYTIWLGRAREQIAALYADAEARQQAWQRVLSSDLREFIPRHNEAEISVRITQMIALPK